MPISVVPARAVDLELHDDRVVVYTDNTPLEADVIVGAFGMDEGSSAMFPHRLTPYRPPKALSSIVTKIHPSPESMQRLVHASMLSFHPIQTSNSG